MPKIRWKKNLFSYLLWIILCCIVCCNFVVTGMEILAGLEIKRRAVSIAAMCVFLIAEVHIFFRFYEEKTAGEPVSEEEETGKYRWPLILVFLFIGLRVGMAFLYGLEPENKALFETAEVTEAASFSSFSHHASYIYFCLISVLFRFFGNRWEIVSAVQLLMQVLAVLLLYPSVKKFMGRPGALGFLFLAAVCPGFLFHYRTISPDLLVCILLGVILLTAGAACSAIEAPAADGKKRWIRLLLPGLMTGILTGICAWLDLWGVAVLAAVLIGILQLDRRDCISQKGILVLVLLLGFCGALAGAFALESAVSGTGFADVLRQYIMPCIENIRLTALPSFHGLELVVVFLVNMLAGMAVIGFFVQKYEKTAVITVLLAGAFGLQLINMTQMSYINLGNILLLLAACAGIQCISDMGYGKMAEIPAPEADPVFEQETAESEGKEENMKEEEIKEKKTEKSPENKNDGSEIKYIPNPLPLPKKHVKKEIAFDFEPKPSQMKFDKEPGPGEDDFDI